jgi:hypothetical protein
MSTNSIHTAPRVQTGVILFSATFAVFYGLCDVYRWPLFSYYPATGLMAWGWTPETAEDGPAMYWYGWVASSTLGALLSALVGAGFPEPLRRWVSPHWAWVLPLAMVPIMAYTLNVYWR